jgi:DNA-binding MarR family transcriptional regulator
MSRRDKIYNVNESFPMLIGNCEKAMRESLNARFRNAGFNVTTEQWIILVHLGQQDGISQQELADRYNRSKVSALNLIKKLEKLGAIIRRSDPVDGRCNRVYLTSEGRKLLHKLIPLAKANITYMSAGISAEEIELLKSTIRKITGNLKR